MNADSDSARSLTEEGRAWLSDADPKQRRLMLRGLVDRFGHETVQADVLAMAFDEKRPDPFARGWIGANELPEASEPTRIWFGLYPATVAIFIGETHAGKSTLLYNVAIHGARNEPLFGTDFGLHRPLNIGYIDPENAGNWDEGKGGNCANKITRIDAGRPKNLRFHDGRGVNLSDPSHMAALRQRIQDHKMDLLILDPIASLFGTKDENDNAEASVQMKALVDLSRETGVCIIACHHTGKDNTGNYGRGASARLASADVGFVFRARGSSEEENDDYTGQLRERDDVCRLQIVKDRLAGFGKVSKFLQMVGGDKFERTDFKAWQAAGTGMKAPTKLEQARTEVVHFLMDGLFHTRKEIVEAMAREEIGENATDKALKAMNEEGLLEVEITQKGTKSYRHKNAKKPSVDRHSFLTPLGGLKNYDAGNGHLNGLAEDEEVGEI